MLKIYVSHASWMVKDVVLRTAENTGHVHVFFCIQLTSETDTRTIYI